jgi:hypothetical protein
MIEKRKPNQFVIQSIKAMLYMALGIFLIGVIWLVGYMWEVVNK